MYIAGIPHNTSVHERLYYTVCWRLGISLYLHIRPITSPHSSVADYNIIFLQNLYPSLATSYIILFHMPIDEFKLMYYHFVLNLHQRVQLVKEKQKIRALMLERFQGNEWIHERLQEVNELET